MITINIEVSSVSFRYRIMYWRSHTCIAYSQSHMIIIFARLPVSVRVRIRAHTHTNTKKWHANRMAVFKAFKIGEKRETAHEILILNTACFQVE